MESLELSRHVAQKPYKRPVARAWSDEENEIIRKHYPDRGYRNMNDLLPDRTHAAIQLQASKLGVRQKNPYDGGSGPGLRPREAGVQSRGSGIA